MNFTLWHSDCALAVEHSISPQQNTSKRGERGLRPVKQSLHDGIHQRPLTALTTRRNNLLERAVSKILDGNCWSITTDDSWRPDSSKRNENERVPSLRLQILILAHDITGQADGRRTACRNVEEQPKPEPLETNNHMHFFILFSGLDHLSRMPRIL